MFWVPGSESAFKTVQFLLSSHDLSFTVSQILKTCGMFEDLLPGTCLSDDKAKQEGKKFQKKTTTFYSSLRSYPYHGRLKYSHQNDKYPPSTLEDFLGKHIESAREKLENSAARLRENEKLSELICRGLNLKELVSQSKWSLAAQQGSLRTLLQLCARRESEFGQLEGRTVVFANYTDVDPLGRVKLAVQDVPEVWLSVSFDLGPVYANCCVKSTYVVSGEQIRVHSFSWMLLHCTPAVDSTGGCYPKGLVLQLSEVYLWDFGNYLSREIAMLFTKQLWGVFFRLQHGNITVHVQLTHRK